MSNPYIIKNNKNIHLRAHLTGQGIVLIDGEFNPDMASSVIQQLLFLDEEGGKDPVQLYINSPGGCVHSGLAIYDTIKSMKRDVSTVATGMAASMGAFILSCGNNGKGIRHITPNAQVMFHEVSAGTKGRLSDMEVSFSHTKHLNDRLHEIIAKSTGQKLKDILALFEKDLWMEGKEVIKFGAADKILTQKR